MLDIRDAQAIADLIDDSERRLKPHFDQMDELERWLLSSGYGATDDYDGGEDWPENVPYSFVSLLMPRMTHAAPRFTFTGGGSKKMREQMMGLQGAQNILARQTRMNLALVPAAMDYLLGFTCLYVDCESQPAHTLTQAQRRMLKGRARFVPEGQSRTARDYKRPPGQPRYYDSAMPRWPISDHLPRHTYGWDQSARTRARIRFFWHDVVEDFDDLRARALDDPEHWDLDAINRLGMVSKEQNAYDAAMSTGPQFQHIKQVRYRMVFIPEGRIPQDDEPEHDDGPDGPRQERIVEPGEHEHGVWLTLGVADGGSTTELRGRRFGEMAKDASATADTRAEFLAKPFYRTGSRTPPYHILGPHLPASHTVPFSPLTANKEQIRLWNDLAAAVNRRMKRYSRQVLYDLKDESVVEAILAAKDDDFVGIPGFETGRSQVIERGGASQVDLAHKIDVQQTVYRGLGMSETLQGNATNATATAESQAAQTGLSRVGLIVDGWEQGLAEVAEDQAWHMAYSGDFWVVLDEQAKIEQALGDMQPFIEAGVVDAQSAERIARIAAEREVAVWQGGDFAEDPSLDFGLVRVEIEPSSMERRDLTQQKQDVLTLLPIVLQIGQAVIAQPHIEWKEMLRMVGRVFRQPDLEKMLHMDIAQQLSQIALSQGLQDVEMGAALPSGTTKIGQGGSGFVSGRGAGRPASPAGAKPAGGAATQAAPAVGVGVSA